MYTLNCQPQSYTVFLHAGVLFGVATILRIPFCSTKHKQQCPCLLPVHVDHVVMETFSSLIYLATKYKPHVHTAMGISIYAVIITTATTEVNITLD